MKIAIIDADLLDRGRNHRFPNLACMKISGWHKSRGDAVELITDWRTLNSDLFDKIYCSKVFTETPVPQDFLKIPNVSFGGTGFFFDKAPPLPDEIEHHMPDYGVYGAWALKQLQDGVKPSSLKYYLAFSIGFTTRGCIRQCPFCVNRNMTQVRRHSPVKEFYDKSKKYISLWDDNILAFKDWKKIFVTLNATGKSFEFKQGMDFRLMTKQKADVLMRSNYLDDYIFSFDRVEDTDVISSNLRDIWSPKLAGRTKFYVLVGYDPSGMYDEAFWLEDMQSAFARLKILSRHKCKPYIMRYERCYTGPYAWFYTVLATWCNQVNILRRMNFDDVFFHRGQKAKAEYVELLKNDWFRQCVKMHFAPGEVQEEKKSTSLTKQEFLLRIGQEYHLNKKGSGQGNHLKAEGDTATVIGRKFGVSRETVKRAHKKYLDTCSK